MPLEGTNPIAVCTIAQHRLSILAGARQKVAVGSNRAVKHSGVKIIQDLQLVSAQWRVSPVGQVDYWS